MSTPPKKGIWPGAKISEVAWVLGVPTSIILLNKSCAWRPSWAEFKNLLCESIVVFGSSHNKVSQMSECAFQKSLTDASNNCGNHMWSPPFDFCSSHWVNMNWMERLTCEHCEWFTVTEKWSTVRPLNPNLSAVIQASEKGGSRVSAPSHSAEGLLRVHYSRHSRR